MGVKLLLADPNSEWLKEAADFFSGLCYEVETCSNGKRSQLMLYNHKFFATILNLEIQDHPGIQVLKFIKANYPSMKIILIMSREETLKENGLDRALLAKQGIVDVFIMPYQLRELQQSLEGHQSFEEIISRSKTREGVSAEEEVDSSDDQFMKVKIAEFFSTKSVQFDVFIRLREGKYLKILHSGDTFSKERIDTYKNEKKVEYLYFKKEDRIRFVRLQNYISEKTAPNKAVAIETKVGLIKNLAEVYVEGIYTEGLKPVLIDQGKALCGNIYEVVHNNSDLFKLLRTYSEKNNSLYAHSYMVTLFSSMIIKQFVWESKIVNESVGMAALLHDIGRTVQPAELKEMSPNNMTKEQLEIYKKHPEEGVKILNGYPQIQEAVKQIILQHHERINGEGFPTGLRSHKILALAQIVGVADEFVQIMVDGALKAPEALKKMLADPTCTKRHSAIILENFLKVFIDPGKSNMNSLTSKGPTKQSA
ncbi:MAG: HD domain-containing protein [Oligoflexia bacterium]|nr:HD domain-containing protein [Oligoflexia bacterium]